MFKNITGIIEKGDQMILAAAVKYEVEKTKNTVILCGARHKDAFNQLKALGFKSRKEYVEMEQGFIDHHNNFLTRKEAYEHAKACGQLCKNIIYEREKSGSRELRSEDLW